MRDFPLRGEVETILEYGCYIKGSFPKTINTFFLHKNQIVVNTIQHPNEVVEIGKSLKFRIIGINPQTLRLNISCLEMFNPLSQR